MPTATDGFLAPRGLLVDKKFCCQTVSFADIHNALQNTEKLPYTDQSLKTVGFTDTGFNAVYYGKVTEVCDYVITAGACARNDYDIIFDGLADLYKDPDNESLHRQIDQTIKHRVEALRKISNVAASVKTGMTNAVKTIIENQAKLGDVARPLHDSSTISELLRESDRDDEDYQQDMEALQSLLKIMANQKMEDQSGPTLGDLEKLLGWQALNSTQLVYPAGFNTSAPDDEINVSFRLTPNYAALAEAAARSEVCWSDTTEEAKGCMKGVRARTVGDFKEASAWE
ncbi:hypothetical protein F4809DRAFT_656737 [Biscogniauxia mediterranea]|nr:hypothetical protein F4809DRAFT_656737 [Biscogniauxia mediterranea]